jgi:hypothetical protein
MIADKKSVRVRKGASPTAVILPGLLKESVGQRSIDLVLWQSWLLLSTGWAKPTSNPLSYKSTVNVNIAAPITNIVKTYEVVTRKRGVLHHGTENNGVSALVGMHIIVLSHSSAHGERIGLVEKCHDEAIGFKCTAVPSRLIYLLDGTLEMNHDLLCGLVVLL